MNTKQSRWGYKEKNTAGRMRLERKRLRLSRMSHAMAQLLLKKKKVANIFHTVNWITQSCR